MLNRGGGGVQSRFLTLNYDFLPPKFLHPEIPNYIEIILGGKVGSYG